METQDFYKFLKYCPECGKELERDPIAGTNACFLHGDFVIRNDSIVWKFTKNIIPREV
jgi:hypothetical protein